MATINTNFSDTDGKGSITLYSNPFGNGPKYFGRFDRNTIDTNTLIARIQKRKAGTNELAIQQAAGFLKEEILEALRNGEAVNVMDLGFLYIVPNTKFNGTSIEERTGKILSVRFTPSQLVRDSVDSIEIKSITVAQIGPRILTITDTFTGNTDGTMTRGKIVQLSGEHLKISGEGSGVFFCPMDGIAPETDRSKWTETPKIVSTTNKILEVYVPENLEAGTAYSIVLRTRFAGYKTQLKETREVWSNTVIAE